jgi:hypothetical protein
MLIAITAVAGENNEIQFNIGEARDIIDQGKLSYPVFIHDVKSLIAFTIILKYKGTIQDMEFKPGTFLHEPLVIPPRIDPEAKTVKISLAATQRVVTRKHEGKIGDLIFNCQSVPTSIEIVEALLVDEHFSLDVINSSGDYSIYKPDDEIESESEQINYDTNIEQNYPNPANPMTSILFSIRTASDVVINIYDVNGRLIKSLVNQRLPAGEHTIIWNGLDNNAKVVSSGIYFYKFTAGDYSETKKIVLIR